MLSRVGGSVLFRTVASSASRGGSTGPLVAPPPFSSSIQLRPVSVLVSPVLVLLAFPPSLVAGGITGGTSAVPTVALPVLPLLLFAPSAPRSRIGSMAPLPAP